MQRPERKSRRKYNFCDNNKVGDEFHYFMKFSNPHFIVLREGFKKDILKLNSNLPEVIEHKTFIPVYYK